jgi:AcrR family transcriptional regulator
MPTRDSSSFLDSPSNTREAILQATHEVLCEQGYDDASTARIAERAGVSKSVLYHHYDDKDDLFRALLDATLSAFVTESLGAADGRDDGLSRFVERVLADPLPGDVADSNSAVTVEFARTYVELRARAAHDPRYRDHFTRAEARLRREFAEARSPDDSPRHTVDATERLLTLAQGIVFQRVTTDDVALEALRAEVERAAERGAGDESAEDA